MTDNIITADEIFAALRARDSTIQRPSEPQKRIIEAPAAPAVVIAGAGSGKTETMTARVLFLVANGWAAPNEILGLTFTRKAAGELRARIRNRLKELNSTAFMQEIRHGKPSSFDVPVMTYHSYAGQIVGEHAIRCGIDAADEPIGDAQLWQLAFDLVSNWDDPNFRSESALSTVIKDVIGLSRNILEHEGMKRDFQRETEMITREILDQLTTIEASGSQSNESVRRLALVLNQRLSIFPMARKLIDKREREGLLSFDDQMSLAARISENFLDVAEIERARYKFVLLDEYQDTSQSQVRMLSSLFGAGHPVMAVGDPCQAIYTWRGASAGTIGAFSHHFPHPGGESKNLVFSLPTTYRNDEIILELANEVSLPIRLDGLVPIQELEARPGAGAGELACGIYENIEIEAQAIAQYFAPLWFAPERMASEESKRSSFAVLVRKRSQIPEIEAALRAADIPVEVLGVGGLLHVAEVADVIALVKVIADPNAGASLMRHLTGPRINLGAADIAALGRFSRSKADAAYANSRNRVAQIALGNPDQEEADDQILGSLIDALDEIDGIKTKEIDNFSPQGLKRLKGFASDLRRLRSRAGGSLIDLVTEIEMYLFLDVEVSLRDWPQNGRRHLDRFLDEVSKFSRSGGTMKEFITWLDNAESEEGGLKSGAPEVRSDVVTILTVHMAKGAEWNVVAIPGLAEKNFPSEGREKDNWLTDEKHIPFELRGDSEQLPKFGISHCTTNAEVKRTLEAFSDECDRLKYEEEIRLGYVAITRAKDHLLCTTSYWRDGVKPVAPSSIYNSVAHIAATRGGLILSDAERPADTARNPQNEIPEMGQWPRDPMGSRRQTFLEEVHLVDSAQSHSLESTNDSEIDREVESWVTDARALINEMRSANTSNQVYLPPRLSVSTLIALQEDPTALALAIRRPMPGIQDEYSRRGTVFHQWIETYFGQGTLFDDEDLDPLDPLDPSENSEIGTDNTLEALKEAWLSSSWAKEQPYAVEVPFETVLGGVLVRGRIDAVYQFGDRYEVVDWKTGSKKLGESARIQLAMYRLAWAKLHSVPVEKVSAAFHYVPTGVTDRPTELMTESELIALIEKH